MYNIVSISAIHKSDYLYTHTHTHICIYIYICCIAQGTIFNILGKTTMEKNIKMYILNVYINVY